MQNQSINNKYRKIGLIVSLIAVPIIIYFYFLRWKTSVISNDDLSLYLNYLSLDAFYDKLNLPLLYRKYRPIQGLGIIFLIETFQKNLDGYYLFNVIIQALVTLAFALNVNLFLKSPIYSLFISLTVGLSRYAYYNLTQLLNGGTLEGFAMIFFLLSLFFILQILIGDDDTVAQKRKAIVLSILFANLSFYTHERYIVITPLFALSILFFPKFKVLALKQRLTLAFAALFSIVLNVVIKKYIYSTPFFVGTGDASVSPSLATIFRSFTQAILSIFQINTQAEYVFGLKFVSLPLIDKMLTLLIAVNFLLILVLFISKMLKPFIYNRTSTPEKRTENYFNLLIFLSLIILLIFLLVPAVVTIRVEQRWLQAPLSVFILTIIVAAKSLFMKSHIKTTFFSAFIILFIWTDYNYTSKGYKNFYFQEAADRALAMKQAIDNGTIRAAVDNLYIWERQKDIVRKEGYDWALISGKFFSVYQNKSKKIFFIDSTDVKLNLDKSSDQVIFIDDTEILDLTDFYLRDSIPEKYKRQ